MPPTFSHSDIPAGRVVEALRSWGFDVGAPRQLVRTLLDTFDGRLNAAGLRLAHVRGAEAALVLDERGPGPTARLVWATPPTWPADLPDGPFRSRLAAATGDRALLPVLTLTSSTCVARLADRRGKVIVAIELHEHPAAAGIEPSSVPWLAEIVPISGHTGAAAENANRLRRLGLDATDQDAASVLAGAASVSLAGHDTSPAVVLSPDDDALGAFRKVLGKLAGTIDATREGAVAATDPEFLHDLRVALRRTRSVLAEGNGVLPDDVRDRYRQGFGWLGQVTGPLRDLDVYVLGWDEYAAPLGAADAAALEPVRVELVDRRRAAHRELAAALRGDAAAELLDGWRRWLDGPVGIAAVATPVGPFVARRVERAQAKVLRGGRAITPDSDPERLHDLRKDAKRLRYLLECFGGLLAIKATKVFVSELKALQDNLGDHQDAEVHLAQLRDLAHDLYRRPDVGADVVLAMGRLGDHLDRRRLRERVDFAGRFAAYDTRANHQALADLLRPISGR